MEKRKEIENLIFQSLPTLSPNQKKVAGFFLEHMNLVALLPIKNISREAPSSEYGRGWTRPSFV